MEPVLAASPLLERLNTAQRKAVTSTAATVAILAGPGSGKTHTLTSRVVWLIDSMGYEPHEVLVATFTVKAAREMNGLGVGDGWRLDSPATAERLRLAVGDDLVRKAEVKQKEGEKSFFVAVS